jgi:predicted nucleic acid-binding protein
MASYYDSSLLLAGVLGQLPEAGLADLWDRETVRLTSTLLEAECVIGLRRTAVAAHQEADGEWVTVRLACLQPYIDGLTAKPVDDEVLAILRGDPRLANCRALDAIHLATALYYQPHLDAPLRICTLDKRMRVAAIEMGFVVAPS